MKGLGIIAAVTLCAPIVAAQAQLPTDAPEQSPIGVQQNYTFNFKQTSQNSCVLQSGAIIFDAAGNASVHLATMTTDNNDIWKSRIRLRNVAGTPVFTSPELNSPKMENHNGHPQTYNWSYSFHIDPSLLPSISQAEMFDIYC